MRTAIVASELRKRYQIGERHAYGSLRDSIAKALRAPFAARPARRGEMDASSMWALDGVSFSVPEGDIVGIIGRNGSGKSTLLKILSRITEPTSGYAEVTGRVGSLLEVGTGFHPELSGRENVFVNGAILGMKKAEIAARFDEIVAFAGVDRFIDTPVKFYSSGMQMRLAFAVAAHLDPEILLIDEVLAVGDLAFQKKCLGKMDDVSRSGRTILFVSHQMNQLRRLCQRCVWLDGGRVVAVGPTADVVNSYEASAMRRDARSDAERSLGARFLGWSLASDADVYVVDSFGPVTVRFRLRIDRPMSNVHHGVVLYDRDGQLIWGTGVDNLQLSPGSVEIVHSLEILPVRPGPYRWYATVYEGGRFIDGYDSVPEMSVETQPLGHRQDEWAGVLNFPHSTAVQRIAEAVPPRLTASEIFSR